MVSKPQNHYKSTPRLNSAIIPNSSDIKKTSQPHEDDWNKMLNMFEQTWSSWSTSCSFQAIRKLICVRFSESEALIGDMRLDCWCIHTCGNHINVASFHWVIASLSEVFDSLVNECPCLNQIEWDETELYLRHLWFYTERRRSSPRRWLDCGGRNLAGRQAWTTCCSWSKCWVPSLSSMLASDLCSFY